MIWVSLLTHSQELVNGLVGEEGGLNQHLAGFGFISLDREIPHTRLSASGRFEVFIFAYPP